MVSGEWWVVGGGWWVQCRQDRKKGWMGLEGGVDGGVRAGNLGDQLPRHCGTARVLGSRSGSVPIE